jgi:hypothetical protein
MQINADGTKTMEMGSEKMIYQWNDDLNIVTQQTEESKRAGCKSTLCGSITYS